ncbi:thiamine-phosphate pyrophosphorylase [Candidatus Marinarcus aquaticus]|uniref:Thiamine-phosphate pyrophosphorylase n=1 Tax=Candidatus Marinarcus aquaticus TaxID=2044504 RepID=A0A4Q0XRC2_9BACT|nr:thiamine-phosphate pyrophosphorylase [Candidatus Marinarcus aquaticus]RXJ58208.1 thiamine-phosphate pyrophosphorylase [Candidatus Marinarcus aquaticus]
MIPSNELRLIDANLNRLREGIRVVEDMFRYIYNDKTLASRLKELRHQARLECYEALLDSRDIKNDVLKQSTASEQTRQDIYSVMIANFKRAQESARVLEEFTKIQSVQNSETFKYIRYELYDLEKALTKITSNSK